MLVQRTHWRTLGIIGALAGSNLQGCIDQASGVEQPVEIEAQSGNSTDYFGAADLEGSTPPSLRFRADMPALNTLFPGPTMTRIQDAFRVTVDLGGGRTIRSNSHLFGTGTNPKVNVIPFDDGELDRTNPDHWTINERTLTYGNGRSALVRGDQAVAQYFPPGRIGFAIKHHRPEHRVLSLTSASASGADDLKESMKLLDTHIELVIGVRRPFDHDSNPATPAQLVDGVVTLNNPQDYEAGRFGTADYPFILVEPTYPRYLQGQYVAAASGRRPVVDAFNDNIRTMMLGFNAVSVFPSDYNGGDPLAVHTRADLFRHTAMMVKAIAGNAEARAFFAQPENLVYCAELGFISLTAGMHFPLNERTFVRGEGLRAGETALVTAEEWQRFTQELAKHNADGNSTFDTLNRNGLAYLVQGTTAPESLAPAYAYASRTQQAAQAELLAFQPMTMADIVQEFMRTHLPRQTLGEQLAPAQGALLAALKPGLLESMGMDQMPETDPRRQAVEALYAELVRVVSTPHANYRAFQTAIEPLMVQARAMTGPRGGDGVGLFVPPSIFHVVAQGRRTGMLGLRYVGHGLHYTVVNPN